MQVNPIKAICWRIEELLEFQCNQVFWNLSTFLVFAWYCKHCHHCNEFPELKCIVGLKCNQFFWNFSKSLRCTVLLTSGALLTSTHSRELHRAVLHCGTLGPSHSSTLSTGQVGSCCIASMLDFSYPTTTTTQHLLCCQDAVDCSENLSEATT